MGKNTFLNELFNYLKEKNVSRKDIEKMIEEYTMLYEEALDQGLNHQEVQKKLGQPKEIYEAFKPDLKFTQNDNKLVAISPFIALIIFFAIGFGFNRFDFAWLAFLMIPVLAILTRVRGAERYIALTPFISITIFMLVGFLSGIWHPTWLIFLIIPVTAITFKVDENKVLALSPFVALITYIIVSFLYPEFYQYGWAVFVVVPLIYLLTKPYSFHKLTSAVLLILALVAHQVIFHFTNYSDYAWMVYLVPLLYAFLTGQFKFVVNDLDIWRKTPILAISVLIIILIYLGVILIFPETYRWSWVILLFIPMIAIYTTQKFKYIVAYTPFIALMIFILVGEFLDKWEVSWLIFLIIPIAGILTGTDDKEKESEDE